MIDIKEKIDKKLPKNVEIGESWLDDLNKDEYIVLVNWIHYFSIHCAKYGLDKLPDIFLPMLSTRYGLDLGLAQNKNKDGKHMIYIFPLEEKINKLEKLYSLDRDPKTGERF